MFPTEFEVGQVVLGRELGEGGGEVDGGGRPGGVEADQPGHLVNKTRTD